MHWSKILTNNDTLNCLSYQFTKNKKLPKSSFAVPSYCHNQRIMHACAKVLLWTVSLHRSVQSIDYHMLKYQSNTIKQKALRSKELWSMCLYGKVSPNRFGYSPTPNQKMSNQGLWSMLVYKQSCLGYDIPLPTIYLLDTHCRTTVLVSLFKLPLTEISHANTV